MSTILFGGLKYTQIRHAIYCKICTDTIESTSVHDYKVCRCGAVGVDGGILPGNRILGNVAHMEDRSMYRATVGRKVFWLPENSIRDHFSKNLSLEQK